MDKTPKPHDCFVTDEDFIHVQDAVSRNQFNDLVYDLMTREPDMAVDVSERFSHMLTLLDGVSMSIKQREIIKKHLALLTWTPLLALARAHRRAWEDFLPSTEVVDESDSEGGAE
jgi:hypothetical protein